MIYIDTSALAKWYTPEEGSEEVEEYIRGNPPLGISLLTNVEMQSLLARRRRPRHLDAEIQGMILATFEGDIVAGHLRVVPHTVDAFLTAEATLGAHPELGLTNLDALHLGTVISAGITTLATADAMMARATRALGLECRTFPRGASDPG